MSPSTRRLFVCAIAVLCAVVAPAAAQPRVTVAVIDSGIDPNRAFDGRIKGFHDISDGRLRHRKVAYDDDSRGTHVAGLIGWIGLLGARQSADDIEHQAVAPDLPLGHPVFEDASTDLLVRAVEAATRAGIVVVVSAGNFGNQDTFDIGYAGTTSPGNAPSAITAGAYDHKASITRDVDDDGERFDVLTRGTGGINAGGALRVGLSIDFTSADTLKKWSTLTCQDEQAREDEILTGCQTSIAGTTHVWARNIVWGENIVWGDTVLFNLPSWNLLNVDEPDGTTFGGNIVWGESFTCTDGQGWGDELVQPLDNIVWGDNILWA